MCARYDDTNDATRTGTVSGIRLHKAKLSAHQRAAEDSRRRRTVAAGLVQLFRAMVCWASGANTRRKWQQHRRGMGAPQAAALVLPVHVRQPAEAARQRRAAAHAGRAAGERGYISFGLKVADHHVQGAQEARVVSGDHRQLPEAVGSEYVVNVAFALRSACVTIEIPL